MNLAHGPKIRTLTTNESLSSLEQWKSNVIYGLRLNSDFREYLEDGFNFGRKSRANPTRDLADIYRKEQHTVKDGNGKDVVQEVLVKVKSKEDRTFDVDLLLDQAPNYCPRVS